MEVESEAASVASAAPELHPTTNQTIVAADTFGDHTINEGGVLSMQLRVRGFMRQKADTHKEGVDFRRSFYPSLAAHLSTSGISLSHDAPHRKNTSLKYAKLVGKVRDALASQTLRADRCPQARSDYLNSFVSLKSRGSATSPDRSAGTHDKDSVALDRLRRKKKMQKGAELNLGQDNRSVAPDHCATRGENFILRRIFSMIHGKQIAHFSALPEPFRGNPKRSEHAGAPIVGGYTRTIPWTHCTQTRLIRTLLSGTSHAMG